MARSPKPPGPPGPDALPARRNRGFEPAGRLAQAPIAQGSRKRGALLARLLPHWSEIVGADLAAMTRPLRTAFGRDGLGATLTLAAAPAHGLVVQMRLPDLQQRINAALGYAAVARIRIAPADGAGFAEAAAPPLGPPIAPPPHPAPSARLAAPSATAAVADRAAPAPGAGVTDPGLRAALETLGRNVLTRARTTGGPQ